MADANDKGASADGNSVSAAPPRRERRRAQVAAQEIEAAEASRARVMSMQPRAERTQDADEAEGSRRHAASDRAEPERRARLQRAPDELDDVAVAAVAARARRALEERYVINGQEYRFRNEPTRVAFRDDGKRLTTEFNTAEVTRGMVDAAQSKGWKTLQVNGTEEFKRQLWMEAELRGLGVRGYTPTQFDRDLLENERSVRAAQNSVMARWRSRDAERAEAQRGQPESQGFRQPDGREVGDAKLADLPAPPTRAAQPAPEQVVAMGPAPYNFDKQEEESYYLQLRGAQGKERHVWGKDLYRAVEAAHIRVGDAIRLHLQERQPVEVIGNKRGENNEVIGRGLKHTHRNGWKIEKVDVAREASRAALEQVLNKQGVTEPLRAQVRDAADVRLAQHAAEGRMPPMQMYDRAAPREVERPARQREPSRPLDRGSTPRR